MCGLRYFTIHFVGIGLLGANGVNASFGQSPIGQPAYSDLAGKTVAVELVSHVVVTGVVDQQTDDGTLWLRKSTGQATLWSGYPTQRIVRYEEVPGVPPEGSTRKQLEIDDSAGCCDFDRRLDDDRFRPATQQITAVEIFAEPANFDDDVEIDGLRTWIRPIDRFGNTVVVAGRADVSLFGEHRDWRGGRHDLRRPQFVELQRWSKRVDREVATADGFQVNLEFRNFHPDRELDVTADALLNLRFSVPGHGVICASFDRLQLRSWSKFRDDLQQSTGRRYLPQERTSIDLNP